MLSLPFVRENKATVIEGLKRRGFSQLELIDQLLDLDQHRRQAQSDLDQKLAEANQKAKEMGALFKSGQTEAAQQLKETSASLKSESKS